MGALEVENEIRIAASKRLQIPDSMVRVWKCPLCGIRAFVGYLAPGSYLVVRCTKSNCAHHQPKCGWTASTVQPNGRQPDGSLLHCRSDFCLRPWQSPDCMDVDLRPTYDNGNPVCGRPWAHGRLSSGSRIIVWCKQGTCANHQNGFMLCPS